MCYRTLPEGAIRTKIRWCWVDPTPASQDSLEVILWTRGCTSHGNSSVMVSTQDYGCFVILTEILYGVLSWVS